MYLHRIRLSTHTFNVVASNDETAFQLAREKWLGLLPKDINPNMKIEFSLQVECRVDAIEGVLANG
ncbi:MAG: hypothetical protein M1378_00200 [Bacteroidetes bacterium]|nr:hypothetical protein [Bacteroidota bacterium]